MAKFKVGDRVVWVFGDNRDTGTIVNQDHEGSSWWMVKWDSNGNNSIAYEENLYLLEKDNIPWYETEEGKQWLSEQMDVEECFNKSQDSITCNPTYSIGQRFKVFYREERYWDCILAQVAPLEVCLIDIDSGNRMRDPFSVGDTNNVTIKEMKEISYGLEFVLT